MPRIRKKTSNRQTSNDRRKIQRKVRESRKKAKKAAKNNPQWKSKTPKDPGIPNNFPFKDQILAEVAEQRRIEAAEKLRKREERKVLRAKAKNSDMKDTSNDNAEDTGGETTVEVEELKGLQVGNDAVGGIGAKQLLHAKAFSRSLPVPQPEDSDEDTIPVLANRDLLHLEAVLNDADVVIEVLDARDPLPCRSSHLEGLVAAKEGQQLLLLLNKIDTCPLESVTAWAAYLRTQYPTLLFRSASAFLPLGPEPSTKGKGKGKAKAPTDDGLGVDSVLECLGHCTTTNRGDEPLTVAVVGVTNTGKSSFVNSLIRSSSLPVYSVESASRGPTTTEIPQEVLIESGGRQIRLIDTPGLSWEVDESVKYQGSIRARDILLRSKGRIDRLKDPTSVVTSIVARSNTEDLMLLYSLPAFVDDDSTSFLSGVARSKQLVRKRGQLDLLGASRILLRDWSTGKFARYSIPPTTVASTTCPPKTHDSIFEKLYRSDATTLETVAPRKELRKSVGLVKISSGEVDSRKVILRDNLIQESDSEGGSEEDQQVPGFYGDDDDDGSQEAVQDDDEQVDEDVSNNGDDREAALLSNKQKRKRTNEFLAAPANKKVAFAPGPKVAKQARKAASLKGKISDEPQTKPVSKATMKPANAKLRIQHKVANIGAKSRKGTNNGEDELYDFGKFF